MRKDEQYEYDPCEDCEAVGDDWYPDENGEAVNACLECPMMEMEIEE